MNKRRKVIIAAAMALSILIGMCLYLGTDRKSAGAMTVHFSGYTTNSAGIRECTVMFENAAWDCIITPRIMVCSEPEKARNARKVLDNQGRRIWPKLSFDVEPLAVLLSSNVVATGQSATIRFTEPPVQPWMVAVRCERTNMSKLAIEAAKLNRIVTKKFRIPMWFGLEQSRAVSSEIIEREE